MTSRNARRPPNTLTIQPPSPGFHPPRITTPINQIIPQIISPRKAPLPPSPTYSNHSSFSGLSAHDARPRKGSFDVDAPAVPRKDDKRFGGLQLPRSPRKRPVGEDQGTGMYDNKLHSLPAPAYSPSVAYAYRQWPLSPPLSAQYDGAEHKPQIVLLFDYAPAVHVSHAIFDWRAASRRNDACHGRGVKVGWPSQGDLSTLEPQQSLEPAHYPCAADLCGKPVEITHGGSQVGCHRTKLMSSHLCHSHIIATSQRTAPSRLIAVLSSDLRDFIASGMLTLKSRLETADDTILIPRLAETWKFFWTHILSYLEGVFLPFSQMRDLPSSATPFPVRHILSSGFMLNILLPLLSRLSILVSNPDVLPPEARPAIPDMQQILQMVLVLGTQARYSTFVPFPSQEEGDQADEEVKENVQALGRAVRWRIGVLTQPLPSADGSPVKSPLGVPKRASLQRVSSLTQAGKHRRPGWRASNAFGQAQVPLHSSLEGLHPSRQNSDFFQPESRWGRPRVDEEDEDDHPGHASRQDSYGYGSTATASAVPSAASTLTAGTWREGHGYGERTPQEFGRRALQRADTGESEATPVAARGQRL